MKYTEIKKLSIEDAKKSLHDSKKKLLFMRLQRASSELTKVHELKKEKKIVARLLTHLTAIEKSNEN